MRLESSGSQQLQETRLLDPTLLLKQVAFEADLELVTLGFVESGCESALSPPTVGSKTQICTHIHPNLESQIPSLHIRE